MLRNLLAAAVVVVLGGAVVADELKSGPQMGDKVPGPFHPYTVTGEDAGKHVCLYCKAGLSPTVAVFVRNPDDPLTHKLLKALDAETTKNAKAEMQSFAVFCGGKKDKLEPKLKEIAKNAELKSLVLAIEEQDDPIPEKYKLNKDADVTVILYVDLGVKANYTFAKGKLTDKDIDAIIKDVSQIVK